MDVKLYTLDGVQTSLQVSTLGNIPEGDFNIGRSFLVKNITDSNIRVTVIMANNTEIETIFYPGWNPEIVKGIKNAPSNSLQYGS